jgi:L-fucose mutarotase
MLKHQLIHGEINGILGRCGHHAKILIADGNYPASSTLGPNATLVSLNLMPGVVSCTQVLESLLSAIPIEAANTMGIPADDPYALRGDPPIWSEYRRIFQAAGLDLELQPIDKWQFYDAVASRDHVLTIQTAEQALWANLLLTVGVRKPDCD